jgi:hypothetical protein
LGNFVDLTNITFGTGNGEYYTAFPLKATPKAGTFAFCVFEQTEEIRFLPVSKKSECEINQR